MNTPFSFNAAIGLVINSIINSTVSLVFISILFLTIAAGCSDSNSFQTCNDPQLTVTSIVSTKTNTVIQMQYKLAEDEDEPMEVGVQKAREAGAFIVSDPTHQHYYPLQDVQGIETLPKMHNLIKKGDKINFTLVYPLIPLTSFDLFEGNHTQEDLETWSCDNIKQVSSPLIKKPSTASINTKPKITDLTPETYKQLKENSKGYDIIDFWAEWCGPCKKMLPEYKKSAQILGGKIRFHKIDTEAHSELSTENNINFIPTTIVYKDGKEIARRSGGLTKIEIIEWVQYLMKDVTSQIKK